jgi:glycosyltransferase involved in cell wall biosynthesis
MLAAVSDDVAREVAALIPGKPVAIVHNPVDGKEIRSRAESGTSKGRVFRLCAIGRLTRQKGIDTLLRALGLVGSELPRRWELVVLGDGPLRVSLERLVARLALDDHVIFAGWVENPYALLTKADVFVHPARWEGFGLAIVEALALGVPILATSCPGGPSDILADGRWGVLVPPDDPAALGGALLRLIEDADLRHRLSLAGVERAVDFSPVAVAGRLVALAGEAEGFRSGAPAKSMEPPP